MHLNICRRMQPHFRVCVRVQPSHPTRTPTERNTRSHTKERGISHTSSPPPHREALRQDPTRESRVMASPGTRVRQALAKDLSPPPTTTAPDVRSRAPLTAGCPPCDRHRQVSTQFGRVPPPCTTFMAGLWWPAGTSWGSRIILLRGCLIACPDRSAHRPRLMPLYYLSLFVACTAFADFYTAPQSEEGK